MDVRRQRRRRAVTRADLFVITLCAALVGAAFARSWASPSAGWVEVRAGDTLVGRYALDEDRDVTVHGRLGDSHLRIEGGRVRFIDSPCPNKVCVHAGWLEHGGDVAACIPNGVSIRLGGVRDDAIDAISH
jgi:hypothetical protein